MMDGAKFALLCRPSGHSLPYPSFSATTQRIIVNALEEAWKRLCTQLGSTLNQLGEDQTTIVLKKELHHLLDDEIVPGFFREFFGITSHSSVVNYNGIHPKKMPDLIFQLYLGKRLAPSDYELHVECKPVNAKIGLSPYYGVDGMGCFINGDYACQMRIGFMIAYAQRGYTFHGDLLPIMSTFTSQRPDPLATTQLPVRWLVPESHHRRTWTYANGNPPGDIKLLHVWLTIP
jgi:hypothetical protein